MKIINQLLFILLFATISLSAQVDRKSDLYKTIISKDSLLFNVGFNTCDIKQFENLLSENLKFYHDKDGISDKTKFLFDLKNGHCKNPETRQVKRFLINESTEIFHFTKTELFMVQFKMENICFLKSEKAKPELLNLLTFGNWKTANGNWQHHLVLTIKHLKTVNNQKNEKSI